MLSWDSTVLRAPTLPWVPLHHRSIKQEPIEPSTANGFLSSHSEGFHSASPSSSSHDSNPQSPRSESPLSPPRTHQPQNFRPLTPPGFEISPDNQSRISNNVQSNVTPPKSPSPLQWASNSDGVPSPEGSNADGDEEPGLRVPAVNSHGKVKTFKCKQCEFIAVTKLDFWTHTKSHIKPERMLSCRKCPFVTEYKHHLEYHMRNHFGSKPFQCSQCSYSCVNKSMLNSHLKSHSNIYQYRCADCNYATKYCHSLKLHLRKYQHQPAMVLNQDGTPNPLPIIDVYGTRRGPKQRSCARNHEEPNVGLNNNMIPSQAQSIFPNPFGINFAYGSLLQHSMFVHNNNLNEPTTLSKNTDGSKSPRDEDNNNQLRVIQDANPHLMMQPRFMQEYTHISPGFIPTVTMHSPERPSPRTSPYSPSNAHRSSPHVSLQTEPQPDALDLTSSSTKQNSPPIMRNSSITPTFGTKNRRKGRAFKLDRSIPRVEQADERLAGMLTPEITLVEDKDMKNAEIKMDVHNQLYESIKDKYESEKQVKQNNIHRLTTTETKETPPSKCSPESYACEHCDIVFKDIIMYTMHMGYHGYKDPFTCNMCGERSLDRISFFVHIARSQHS